LSVDSQKYFFIIRSKNNVTAKIFYFRHVQENPELTPPLTIPTKEEYYNNKYYYYHSLEHFFFILQSAIDVVANEVTAPDPKANFTINPNSFTLYLTKLFLTDWQIEFSESFLRLFPFANFVSNFTTGQKSYILNFSDFEASTGSTTYRTISCKIYDRIFPFSELLILSDNMGVDPSQFYGNEAFKTNLQNQDYENTILSFNIRTTQFNDIYDLYIYINDNKSRFKNFKFDEIQEKFVDIQVKLRLKNNIIIPFFLNAGDVFNMQLEILWKQNEKD